MSKIIPRYLLKKMFSPPFKFHSNISFNKSNLMKLLPFHRQMLVSWSQYLSASPENFLKHYLSFYGITITLTLFRMGAFGTAHGWGRGGLPKRSLHPKTCHTYPTMMKFNTVIPYLKKIKKKIWIRDTPLDFCWHQHFFTGNLQIFLYQEIQI